MNSSSDTMEDCRLIQKRSPLMVQRPFSERLDICSCAEIGQVGNGTDLSGLPTYQELRILDLPPEI